MSEQQAEIERAVLACMASAPRIAEKVAGMLEPQDFTVNEHAIVFSTMRHMLSDGTRIDELTLPAEIRKDGHGEDASDVAFDLYRVASRLASVDHGEEYAKAIREEAVRRVLARHWDGAMRRGGDVEDVLAKLESATFAARSRLLDKMDLRELSGASIFECLDETLSASQQGKGFPYPLPSMRAVYGDYERGRYTLLGGASGDGKTTMAFQWIEELCEAGARVCLHELEMTQVQVARLLAVQSGAITQRQAKRLDPWDEPTHARYKETQKRIAGWGLDVVCGPSTPEQIHARQARERYDINVVDHMHKFPRTSAGEYVDMTRYSGQLHRITRDLDCSVIALLQLKKASRDMQGRTRRLEPTIGDLRGSGAMEEDADDALLIYQERDTVDRRTGRGSLIVAKMRDGEPDRAVPIEFAPGVMKFREYDPHAATGRSVLARRQEAS